MAMNDYTFSEDSNAVEVCAEILVPADGLECNVVSTLSFVDGSKASKIACFSLFFQLYFTGFDVLSSVVRGIDYSISSPTDTLNVTFSAGSAVNGTTACANVTIIDDNAVEGNHSFTVHVTGLELDPGGAYSGLMIGTSSSALVNIIDNDGTMLQLCLVLVVYMASSTCVCDPVK